MKLTVILANFFKLKKIVSNLKKNYIPKQHDGFLRLLNLLIFKKENNLQLK